MRKLAFCGYSQWCGGADVKVSENPDGDLPQVRYRLTIALRPIEKVP